MTKAHPHRQVNVHLDTVDDADIIERIKAQPSMVGYVRELVRRDIHDERLGYVALKASELQAENAKLRELCGRALAVIENNCSACAYFYDCNIMNDCKCVAPKKIRDELRELGVVVD